MSQYFHQPDEHFGGNIKVELDLSNYAKKADLERTTDIMHLLWPQKQIWLA